MRDREKVSAPRLRRVRGAGRPWLTPGLLACGWLLLVAVVAGCARDATKYPELHPQDRVVTVELSGIDAGSGRFFTYRSTARRKVDFFVYRDTTGVPHAVLDACRTCYRWKKGYVLEGPEVVCLKCDLRFRIDALADGTGSCIPLPLRTVRRGAALLIPVDELEDGARYF